MACALRPRRRVASASIGRGGARDGRPRGVGSGQSSLSYVHQLSLDKIKIDRGFIRNIATQENARNIVKTVIDLCRNLKFDCVVEGVETAEQVEIILKNL